VYEALEVALKADQITALENFLTQYQAVTDLACIRADIILTGAGTPFAVTAGANVDVGATFSGTLYAKGSAKASLRLPGIKAAKVSADGSVDIAEADIEDWLELWVETTPHTMLLSDGDTIAGWISGSLDR